MGFKRGQTKQLRTRKQQKIKSTQEIAQNHNQNAHKSIVRHSLCQARKWILR